MSEKPALYLRDVANFKANDNGQGRIAPMDKPKNNKGRIRRGLVYSAMAIAAVAALTIYAPRFVDLMLDRMEYQREATQNYNCANYGAAMNRFYGRDVCEDESLHRELLKTSKR